MASFSDVLATANAIADLESASSILSWDQETYMPSGGAPWRAEQLATLSTIAHRLRTSREFKELLDELSIEARNGAASLEPWQAAIVRETSKDVERSLKLPEEHVGELARETARGHETWKEARRQSNFSVFAPSLGRLVKLKREEADYLGYDADPYDALIDLYEPGMTMTVLRPVLERLRAGTFELLDRVRAAATAIDDSPLYQRYDGDKQLAFARQIIDALGYDFGRGRVDLAAHPFCTTFAVDDVRLTTRILENDLRSCLFGLIHEAGHGMYEQGIDPRLARTLAGSGVSMGIHESQSLFWENMIGRSYPFWTWAYPQLQSTFPETLANVGLDQFYRAINVVKPSLIRIEADDLTYNLHISIRMEIENALINGVLDVPDVPARWNALYEEYLGIAPSNDAEGCLQDIHWSFAGFGYFPSYTIGKLYAAMFYEDARRAIPDLEEQISRGRFNELLAWLRSSIHFHGKGVPAAELVNQVSGRGLTEEPFLAHNRRKIDLLYT